jgi:hypothetical protein
VGAHQRPAVALIQVQTGLLSADRVDLEHEAILADAEWQ